MYLSLTKMRLRAHHGLAAVGLLLAAAGGSAYAGNVGISVGIHVPGAPVYVVPAPPPHVHYHYPPPPPVAYYPAPVHRGYWAPPPPPRGNFKHHGPKHRPHPHHHHGHRHRHHR